MTGEAHLRQPAASAKKHLLQRRSWRKAVTERGLEDHEILTGKTGVVVGPEGLHPTDGPVREYHQNLMKEAYGEGGYQPKGSKHKDIQMSNGSFATRPDWGDASPNKQSHDLSYCHGSRIVEDRQPSVEDKWERKTEIRLWVANDERLQREPYFKSRQLEILMGRTERQDWTVTRVVAVESDENRKQLKRALESNGQRVSGLSAVNKAESEHIATLEELQGALTSDNMVTTEEGRPVRPSNPVWEERVVEIQEWPTTTDEAVTEAVLEHLFGDRQGYNPTEIDDVVGELEGGFTVQFPIPKENYLGERLTKGTYVPGLLRSELSPSTKRALSMALEASVEDDNGGLRSNADWERLLGLFALAGDPDTSTRQVVRQVARYLTWLEGKEHREVLYFDAQAEEFRHGPDPDLYAEYVAEVAETASDVANDVEAPRQWYVSYKDRESSRYV